jgi:16S rRNA processing protein RimM
MAYIKHILLGKITKVHGYEGAVTIRLERNFSENIPEMESVFIETDGKPVPFFCDYFEQPDNNTLRTRFTNYDSTEKVKEFVGCKVYLTRSNQSESSLGDSQTLIGYEIHSDKEVLMGTVTGIIENPAQLLLNVITVSGKEILLPLHEDLILGIDIEKKTLRMIIPEGISDIN